MRRFKKGLSLGLVAMMSVSMMACGSGSGDSTTTTSTAAAADATTAADDATTAADETTAAGDETTAADAAATTAAEETIVGEGVGKGSADTITMSWWGGEDRHNATLAAIDAWKKSSNINVEYTYGAWTGWEEKMATAFYSDSAQDLDQVNWNWLSTYNQDGKETFADLNELKDVIDLTQFDQAALDQCTYDGKLLAIPVSMTGRVFYWNETTFKKAGLEVPKTYEDLKNAGNTFKDKLGDDYYPIALGEYDRMILMVFYLESVYGKNWVEDGKLNYTQEEIQKGLDFIKELEDNHVTPTIQKITGDGADSLDKNPNWSEGKYAGIFEWDSSASKFTTALNDGEKLVVGDYFADWGEYKGGFSKVSLGFAITSTAENKKGCAELIQYMVNDEEGAKLMGSERGIPLSKSGYAACEKDNLLDPMTSEANGKMMAWCGYTLDPTFEDAALKSNDGVYYDVMSGLSYGDYDSEEAAQTLMDGINEVLEK